MSLEDGGCERASGAGVIVNLMIRARDSDDFRPAGHIALPVLPSRGTALSVAREEVALNVVVEAIFMPPGCDEHCIATVFVSER